MSRSAVDRPDDLEIARRHAPVGIVSVLVRQNGRYPAAASDPRDEPTHTIGAIADLEALLRRLA